MKHLMNLTNVATEIIMHLYLLDRLPKHLQIIILDICNPQITLTLTEVHLPAYLLLLLMYIRAMVPGMVVLVVPPTLPLLLGHIMFILSLSLDHIPCQCFIILICLLRRIIVIDHLSLRLIIIIEDIMDTILALEMIVGSLVEATIITIKADHHCLLIFLRVLLHLWDSVITIVTVTVTVTVIGITEGKGGKIITEDRTLLLVVVATGGDEIPNLVCGTYSELVYLLQTTSFLSYSFYLTPESWSTSLYHSIICIFQSRM